MISRASLSIKVTGQGHFGCLGPKSLVTMLKFALFALKCIDMTMTKIMTLHVITNVLQLVAKD